MTGGVPRPPGESHPSYRWFLSSKSQRNPQKVNSLIYKDYTLVEHDDGTKVYVSPEEKAQMELEGKLKASKLSLTNGKSKKDPESDSDSGYEVPVLKEKPKSCDCLDRTPRPEMTRNSSYPGEMSPGDNGRINLPPYIVPVETSLTFPMTKQKKKKKKEGKSSGSSSSEEAKSKFSFLKVSKRKSSEIEESPEDVEEREITTKLDRKPIESFEHPKRQYFSMVEDNSDGELELPVEVFPENLPKKYSHGFSLPNFPKDPLKGKERKSRNRNSDPNPLRKMFGVRRHENQQGRYGDAALSQIESDTESADHGSADKSSMSKLTSDKQPKRIMSGLFGSFRKGRNKDKVADNDIERSPATFEIAVKEPSEETPQEVTRTEGIVYAELDMARSPGNVMRREDEKTEYAEIIYPGSKLYVEKQTEEIRKSRENLNSSRENLTEVDEAFTITPDGKKEAAV